jgi:hypothetical protein
MENTKSLIENDDRRFNLRDALAKAGGYGKYQLWATITFALTRSSGMMIFQNFAYLTMEQV